MKVTIQDVNYKRALYIFTSDDVDINYGVFELLEFEDFEREEELIGDFHHLGETTVTRKLDGKNIRYIWKITTVLFQEHVRLLLIKNNLATF